MSNPETPSNQPEKKSASRKPPTSSTKPAAEPPQSEFASLLARMERIVAPLDDFYKATEGDKPEDVKLFWDVRLVRGDNTPLMQTSGNGTLPGLLSGTAITTAPRLIYQEIEDKIAKPFSNKLQDTINSGIADKLLENALKGLPPSVDDGGMAEAVDKEMLRDASAARFEDQQT